MINGTEPQSSSVRPRITIRLLMSLVLIAAIDFVFAKSLKYQLRLASWSSILALVVAYDALVYCTCLAMQKLIHPGPEKGCGFWVTAVFAVVVITSCAGGPLTYALIVLWRGSS